MNPGRVSIIVGCCLALYALAASACGGGASGARAVDFSKVPTATLPASLPQPKIVGSGAAEPGGGSSYTVKDGDTLAGIANRFGVSLEDLRAANPNIDGTSLSIGQSIRLPGSTDGAPPPVAPTATKSAASATEAPTVAPQATAAPAPSATPKPPDTPTATSVGQTYTVENGDIPQTIAAKFGITVDELLTANPGVDPTKLHIGDVLVIPPKRPD